MIWKQRQPDIDVNSFGGLMPDIPKSARPPGSFTSYDTNRNIELVNGRPRTRRGFTPAFTPAGSGAVHALFDWVASGQHRILYMNDMLREFNYGTMLNSPVHTPPGAVPSGVMFARDDDQVFFCYNNEDVYGNSEGHSSGAWVWDGTYLDQCFPRPINKTELPSGGWAFVPGLDGSGVVDTGTKYFGIVLQTRSGGETPPGPTDNPGVFGRIEAKSYNVANPNRTLTVNVTAAWPADAAFAYLIATTSTNSDRFYVVPIDKVAVPGGATTTVSFVLNISDAELSRQGRDIIAEGLTRIKSSTTGAPAIRPHLIMPYQDRMVYAVGNILYISNPFKPQWITEDQHTRQMLKKELITSMFTLNNSLFPCSRQSVNEANASGDLPVEWPSFREVSNKVGTRWLRGAAPNPSHGYALIAHQSGIFRFDGQAFDAEPITENSRAVWKRINQSSFPAEFFIDDDPERQQVYCLAPIDSATVNTLLVWDYSAGMRPGRVKLLGRWTIKEASGAATRSIKYAFFPSSILGGNGTNNYTLLAASTSARPVLAQFHDEVSGEGVSYMDDGDPIQTELDISPLGNVQALEGNTLVTELDFTGAGDVRLQIGAVNDKEASGSDTSTLRDMVPARGLDSENVCVATRPYTVRGKAFRLRLTSGMDGVASWFSLNNLKMWLSGKSER